MNNSTISYSTMKTDHKCGQIWEVEDQMELIEVLQKSHHPIIVGGGSNILFTGDITNDLIAIRMKGKEVLSQDEQSVVVEVGAGEVWDDVVSWSIGNDWGGIENLSLIPGLCGAAPIQNIGAYGVELQDVLAWVEFIDRESLSLRKLSAKECKLGYRDSIFKNELKDKVVITSIALKLTKAQFYKVNIAYGAIEAALNASNIIEPTIRDVGQAVINIRTSKLPDPSILPNNGSFFKNPIIDLPNFAKLKEKFPSMPSYAVDEDRVKVPAGWLIDHAGLKGKRIGDVGTHVNQALVIVNYDKSSGEEVLAFSQMIQKGVMDKYGISLIPEVNMYPG